VAFNSANLFFFVIWASKYIDILRLRWLLLNLQTSSPHSFCHEVTIMPPGLVFDVKYFAFYNLVTV
jgi:hypothetical protein